MNYDDLTKKILEFNKECSTKRPLILIQLTDETFIAGRYESISDESILIYCGDIKIMELKITLSEINNLRLIPDEHILQLVNMNLIKADESSALHKDELENRFKNLDNLGKKLKGLKERFA